MQTIDFILGLTGDFFQAFGIYFHQIKEPFAITNFFRPLDVQGSGTKCFQWSAQVSYLLKQTFFNCEILFKGIFRSEALLTWASFKHAATRKFKSR